MQPIYSRIATILALLAIFASVCMLPAAAAQTTPATPCSTTTDTCLFMPLLRRDALPVSSIEPIATLPGNATDVVADNGYAFVGFEGALSVVDVRILTQPRIVGRYSIPPEAFSPHVTNVVQQGARVYVTTRYVETSCCLSGDLLIFDVQQPGVPKLLGKTSTGGVSDLAVQDQTAFITGAPWVSAAPLLAVYDISNPAAPTWRSSIGDRGGSDVAVTNGSAYVSSINNDSISVVDISDPVTITLQTTKVFSNVGDLVVDGSFLYAAVGTDGVAVFDISVPDEPRLVGQVATGGTAIQLQVVNGRAFVAQGKAGVAVIDVTQPSNPQLLTSYNTLGTAADVWADGDVLYVADSEAGLQILRLVP